MKLKQGEVPKVKPEATIADDRIEEVKRLIPEAVADGKINFESLKEVLEPKLEDEEEAAEHFGLTWPGKNEAKRMARTGAQGTLVPVPGDGVAEETTKNIFIEGENLEVLKILQKSYAGRVKMIYIDPPYNTGNDFIYEDNFREPVEEYLRRTGQVDAGGRELTTNKKSDGRFHSKWLSMMYPRIKLAKDLLRDDGVIFISIDDNESNNLRGLFNEIFGENNFIAQAVWQKIHSIKNDAKYLSENHEYVLIYAKDIDSVQIKLLKRSGEMDLRYSNPDSDKRGSWQSGDLVANGHRRDGNYVVEGPTGKKFTVPYEKHWVYSRVNLLELISDNRVWFGKNGTAFPRKKRFLVEVQKGRKASTLMLSSDVGHNQEGKRVLINLFDGKSVLDNPKPPRLLKHLISLIVDGIKPEIVFDFFAGSGTTGQAVMELNTNDNGYRQYVCVQMPEFLDKNKEVQKIGTEFCESIHKPTNIAEICKERLRRAGKKVKEEHLETKADLGFKVYRLEKSNIAEEQIAVADGQQLSITASGPKKGWEKTDLLAEVMLLEGFPLDATVKTLGEMKANEVILITQEEKERRLFICLDKEVKPETIKQIKFEENDLFICLDEAVSDQDKIRLADKGLIKTI